VTAIAIFGAGGLGRLVYDTLLLSKNLRPVAFLDSDPRKRGRTIEGLPIRGGLEQVPALRRAGVRAAIVAIADSRTRVRMAETLRAQGLRLISAIHPLASIAPSARLGEHLIIGPRVIVCVHATVADHCALAAGAIVEHDNELGTGVFLHPAVRLAGGVRVGRFATLGIGACVIPYRQIGQAARVAPGAVVIRDVPPGATVSGVPATRVPAAASAFIADEKLPTPTAPDADLSRHLAEPETLVKRGSV